MKRIIATALFAVVLFVGIFTLAACSQEQTNTDVVGYEIAETTFVVGDAYDKSKVAITAKMSDESEVSVKNNLVFLGDDAENLKLDANSKFTVAGEYTVNVYILTADDREDNRFFLGEWKIIVKAKKVTE